LEISLLFRKFFIFETWTSFALANEVQVSKIKIIENERKRKGKTKKRSTQ